LAIKKNNNNNNRISLALYDRNFKGAPAWFPFGIFFYYQELYFNAARPYYSRS